MFLVLLFLWRTSAPSPTEQLASVQAQAFVDSFVPGLAVLFVLAIGAVYMILTLRALQSRS